MFKKKKDTEVDLSSLNSILGTGRKLINIGYIMAIIALVLLGTYLIKEWMVLGFLKELLIVISPIFIGFIVAWLFDPAVTYLQNKKVPRVLACIIIYLILLGAIILFLWLIIPNFLNQIKDFIGGIPDILDDITLFIDNIFDSLDKNAALKLVDVKRQIYSSLENLGTSITTDLPEYIFNLLKGIFNGGMTIILGLMIGFYMLFDFDKINKSLIKLLPKNWHSGYKDLTKRINTSLRNYIQGVFLVMFLVFITQCIGLTIAGLEAPMIFALFCAVTDIIPYFGPYIGAIPAIIVGFTISPLTGVCCIISIVVVQLLENNFYQPLIMGHTMKLHPVTIMVGLLIFQHFFGIIGMVVATPVIACLKVIVVFINEKLNIVDKVVDKRDKKEQLI